MVNIGFSFASLMGVILAVSGAGLYFMRSFRPNLARDHDVFFAAVALGAGGILFFNGWRLDPILQFGQLLMGGSAIFFAVESIRLRSVTTEQAKRRTPVVDDDRPVSRVYRAELDDYEQMNERINTRRIPGSYEAEGPEEEADDYDDGERRRYEERPPVRRLNPSSDRIRRRRPKADSRGASPYSNGSPRREEPPRRRPSRPSSDWDEERPSSRRSAYGDRPPRRPSSDRRRDSASYVDYRPVDYPDDESGRPSDYGSRY